MKYLALRGNQTVLIYYNLQIKLQKYQDNYRPFNNFFIFKTGMQIVLNIQVHG